MLTNRSHHILGLVCALAVLPVAPDVVFTGDSSIILVQSAQAQTSTEWIDVAANPNWNDANNWDFGVPTSTVDATHTTTLTDIQVNTTSAVCDDFKGKGADDDRFVQINALKKLHVFGDLFEDGTAVNLKVLLQNGTNDTNRTIVDVDGFAKEITFGGATGIGQTAGYVTVDVAVDVTDCDYVLGDHADILIGGDAADTDIDVDDWGDIDVTGSYNGVLVLGTTDASGSSEATTVNIGDASDLFRQDAGQDWTLRGYTDLTIGDCDETCSGDYHGQFNDDPVVTIEDNAEMTVSGETVKSEWVIRDSALFTGTGKVSQGTWTLEDSARVAAEGDIELGTWVINDDGRVDVSDDVLDGDWTVNGDGGGGANFGLEVTDLLDPDDLVVDAGTVDCENLSVAGAVWDMTLKNGSTVDVDVDGWHDGTHPQGSASGFSQLTYTGAGNKYTVDNQLIIMGEINRTNHTSALEITIGTLGTAVSFFNPATQVVQVVSDLTTIYDFDAEGVTVKILESTAGGSGLEANGPDYDLSEDGPLFTDSPCVRRWNEVVALESSVGGAEVNLVDGYTSTPISGKINPLVVPEAVYAKDITLETNAHVDMNDTAPLNIYYTGDVVVWGTTCTDFDTHPCNSGFSGGTPIELTPALFGDFDADGDGDETSDTDRFKDAWCSCGRDTQHSTAAQYDALTDWDCDGDVDDDDLAQYESNHGTGTPPNITAFDNLSACDPADVCN